MKNIIRFSALALMAPLFGCTAYPLGTAAAVGNAASAASAVKSASLTDMLVSQLGVTNQQAMGGAGAIFSMAQSHMAPADFSKLSSAVPGMSQMLAVAPAISAVTGADSGLMGAAASAIGGGSSLGSIAALGSAFQTLGMNSSMASAFMPVVMQYVQAQGGAATASLLKAALL
jgi:hypothetical protein